MGEILNKNLKLLEKHQPHIYQKLMNYLKGRYTQEDNSVQRILLARQDDLVINMLVVCGEEEYLICDHEDPIGQSYAWIDKYVDPSNKADIVFGMGFGFHLEVLLTSFKNKKVIVIEPNIELFYRILEVRNLDWLIGKAELYVDESTDVLLTRLHALFWDTGKGGIQCQPFEVYAEMFGGLWEDLRGKFIKQVESFTVDVTTRKYFGELWAYNNILNANALNGASNAGGLTGRFKGMPAVLVSAGPSLEKNVHLLRDLKDKCVIMAAGTAVKVLEGYGIKPHFMVGVDAGRTEAEIHRNIRAKDIYFIYSNQVAVDSVKEYSGPKFLMNFPVDMYTAEFFKYAGINSEFFFSGPSVSNTCFDILYKMGCNPIILVGQDLAYTGGSLYAGENPGSAEEELKKDGYFLAKDIYGNDVYTKSSFIAMRNWFEGYFEKVKDQIEIINATEGGLNLQFARNDTLENVIRNGCFSSRGIDALVAEIHRSSRFPESTREKLEEYKKNTLSEIEKLEEYSAQQLKLADLVNRGIYHPSRDKRAFDRMVNRIGELTDKVMASAVFNSLLKNVVEIDFYLVKLGVERAVSELNNYEDIKNVYIHAIKQQNSMLTDKLDKIKAWLTMNE